MSTVDDDMITLHMPARVWAGIDAGADNVVSNAVVDGDERTAQLAQSIRQAGWDQVPWVDGEWPPMEQVISIRLSRVQWRFAADDARACVRVYESLEDEVSAQLGRDALAVIEPILE